MKMRAAVKFSFLVVLLLVVAVVTGCRTVPAVDWNSRVGHYTYDQAVNELGPPDKQAKLSDARTVAQWITLHGGGNFSAGTGFMEGNYGAGVGQTFQQTYRDHVLQLTFGTNDVLAAWSKNY